MNRAERPKGTGMQTMQPRGVCDALGEKGDKSMRCVWYSYSKHNLIISVAQHKSRRQVNAMSVAFLLQTEFEFNMNSKLAIIHVLCWLGCLAGQCWLGCALLASWLKPGSVFALSYLAVFGSWFSWLGWLDFAWPAWLWWPGLAF